MLHFGDLNFYSVPSLPETWQAPMWLKLELGVYAGRLYFEFSEYYAILDFLGIRHARGRIEKPEDSDDDMTDSIQEIAVETPDVFTRKPLSFLQEWLALRRKGQNFDQTPMGFICQGKMLLESHYFFSTVEITLPIQKQNGEVNEETSGGSKDMAAVEEDFCEEAHGDIVRLEDLEDFDEGRFRTLDDVSDDEDDANESM